MKQANIIIIHSLLLGFIVMPVMAGNISDLDQRVKDILNTLPIGATQYSDVTHSGNGGLYFYPGDLQGPVSGFVAGTIPVLGDNVTITSPGGYGYGISINNSTDSAHSIGIIIGDNLSMDFKHAGGDGIRSWGGNQNTNSNPNFVIIGDNVHIIVRGTDADGINAGYSGSRLSPKGSATIALGNNATIETYGNQGRGISAYNIPIFGDANPNKITLGDNAKIYTYGGESEGIRTNGSGAEVTLGKNAYIETHGTILTPAEVAAGQAEGTNIIAGSTDHGSYGLLANGGSKITLGDNSTIVTHGKNAHGVVTGSGDGYAIGGGTITLGKDVTITTNATDDTDGINTNKGKVVLQGGAIITNAGSTATNSYAINSQAGTVDGSALGVYHIIGDLKTGTAGTINLNMDSGSSWTGASHSSGTTDIKMNNSVWEMTDSSNLTNLTTNNANVNFNSSASRFFTLTSNTLQGNNSTFNMNVDLGSIATATSSNGERVGTAGLNGDLIKINNTIDVSHYQLTVKNVGSAATLGNEVLQIVETPTGNDGNFSLTHQVEAGAYEYGLRNATSGVAGWELYGAGRRTTTADATTSFINTNYLLSYVDTQTLLQRMGELRRNGADQQDGDVWVRGFGGQLNSFGGQQLAGFDMTYAGTQIGIDKRIATSSGEAYVGVMGGMTHANPNYRGGDGTTKDYHFGLYGTFIADNGFYVDAVAKYTYMKNHFSVKDTAGNNVQGKGTSDGFSASLEAGKRFHLTETPQAGGYYFEPQAQITYSHQEGMSVNASNGLKAKFSNYNYTIGRASGIFGYEIAGANPVNIYLKTGYVREMDSSVNYKLNDQKQNYDFRGGWWDNGIGVNAQINKKHNIYTELDYAKGSRFDQKQINIGYRYSF